ncbi:MAG: Ig-like domain-containing protein, partial [Deltaproteobacteria bacterium]|nr:Ig-like domain-containing protein [Deltaproteobacteria bacterium]
GNESCLSRLNRLYFKVEDCQSGPTTLSNAVTVYTISKDGTWVDKETVSLSEDPVGAAKPLFFSSQRTSGTNGLPGLLIAESSSFLRGDGILNYPIGQSVDVLAVYEDPYDPTDPGTTPFLRLGTTAALPVSTTARCQKLVSLSVPLPVCFPNAITSGGGGSWNGNFRVHWGDVVIRGSADPSNTSKRIAKSSSAALNGALYSGSGNSDRFFDIYVGYSDPAGTTGGSYVGAASAFQPLQSAGYGNYFGNISYTKITDMMAELDYDTMKNLAKQRAAYWYTLTGTTTIRNPATGQQASLETVLHLSGGPGTRNSYYDGKFIFVDTFAASDPGPTMSGAQLNAALDASLVSAPYFTLGNIYTEGIIYIAGSVDYRSGGGGANITVKTPPEYETRYDHNTAGAITEADLPIRSRPPQPQLTVNLSGININGGVYMKGEALFSGSPRIFGSLSAERGFGGNGTPEIWYNYNLNVDTADTGLCVECCSAELSPMATEIDLGATVQLTAFYTSGGLSWGSEDPSIATVTATGLVRGVAEGTTRIKLVDGNNCPAWTTITVLPACNGFSVSPASATVASGGTKTFQVLKTGAQVTWTVSGPATTVSSTATSITLRGDVVAAPANVTVTARDVNTGCTATATLTVNTASCTLAITPTAVHVTRGSSTMLSVATTNRGNVTWSAGSGGATVTSPGITATVAGGIARTSVAITAVDDFFSGGTCTDIATVTVDCAMPATQTVSVNHGGTVTLTATGGVGPYSWGPSSNAHFADYSPAPGNGASATVAGLQKNKSATFTVTDSQGCRTTFTVNVGN